MRFEPLLMNSYVFVHALECPLEVIPCRTCLTSLLDVSGPARLTLVLLDVESERRLRRHAMYPSVSVVMLSNGLLGRMLHDGGTFRRL